MKTNVRQTSLLAWDSIQKELGERQYQVLDIIRKFGPVTNKDISGLIHLPINCVTPRTKELRKKGLVEEFGTITDRITGRKALAWRSKI